MRKAHARGLRVILNPAPMAANIHDSPLELVDLFILNETEAEGLTGKSNPDEISRAMRQRFPRAATIPAAGIVLGYCPAAPRLFPAGPHPMLTLGLLLAVAVQAAERRADYRADQRRYRDPGHRIHQLALVDRAQQHQPPHGGHHRAADALKKAEAAQACCDATTQRVDRMYQKIMSK